MIKRVMYFYDKKQANAISKLNDTLHKQRGVRVSDVDDTINSIFVDEVISNLTRRLKKLEDDASKIKKVIKEIKNAKDTKSLNNILQSIKGFI